MKHEPTVFVVDDETAQRQSAQWLLESVGLKVKLFASAREFQEYYEDDMPGCLLLDVRMPGISGLDLQENLLAGKLSIPVVVISGHATVGIAVRAMKSGAVNFLEKPYNDEALLECVQDALRIDAERRALRANRDAILQRLARLTPRERQVLEMVVAGRPTKQIAQRLGLSPKTIEIHRAHMMDKMRAGSLAELVRMAVAAGIHADEPPAPEPPKPRPRRRRSGPGSQPPPAAPG